MPWHVVLTQLIIIGLANGAIVALNAMSVSLVYSVVRVLNFAHGDMFGLLTLLVVLGINQFGLNDQQSFLSLAGSLLWVLVVAIGFGVATNVVVERVGFRPFRGRSRLAPLMATLGISFMLYEAVPLVRWTARWFIPQHVAAHEMSFQRIPGLIASTNLLEAAGISSAIVVQRKDLLVLGVALLTASLLWLILHRTRIGLMLRASASDALMAQLCGINDQRAIRVAFVLGGVLAAIAAWMYVLYYTAPYSSFGIQSGLIAFTAALLGGIGRPVGALWSGFLLGIIRAFSDYFLAAQWTSAVLFGVLVVVLLLRRPVTEVEDSSLATAATQRRFKPWQRIAVLLLIGVGSLFPWLNTTLKLGLIFTMTNILIITMLVMGMNLTVGWGGLLDLGYAGCFALGAYTIGVLGTNIRGTTQPLIPVASIGWALIGSAALGAGSGWIIGLLARRLSNEYMALVTFAFGVIVSRLLTNATSITHGSLGISGVPALHFFGLSLAPPTAKYYMAFGVAVLVVVGCRNLLRSPFGRALAAQSDDETAAASCGVPTDQIKRRAWTIAGGIAGVAGGLYATTYSYLIPSLADFRMSVLILIMVVIGGTRRLYAPLIGAVVLAGYDYVLIPRLGAWIEARIPPAQKELWAVIDPRLHSFFVFGLLLYGTVWYRTHRRQA